MVLNEYILYSRYNRRLTNNQRENHGPKERAGGEIKQDCRGQLSAWPG
jgi:hypothetical protein